jgi:hypothetical protein
VEIEFDESGEPLDDVLIAPYWAIEILSPQQSSNRVTIAVLNKVRYALCPMPYARRVPHVTEKGYIKIIHCLQHNCQLGWLIIQTIDLSVFAEPTTAILRR